MNLRVLFASMLVTTAFSAVAQTEENPENSSIAGLFNGVDLDRLTINPIESSLVSDEYGGRAYERMLIKSEKGTVPDLVINKEPGNYSLGFGYGDVHMDDLTIYNLRGVFEAGGPLRDGLLVRVHPEGSTIGKDYTYLCRDGRWTLTPPLIPHYMTFRQCAAVWPEAYERLKVTGIWCKNFKGEKQTTTIALFPASDGKFQIKMDTSGKEETDELVDNEGGKVECMPISVATYPDWWSHGEQQLLVEDESHDAKLYRLVWEAPDGGFVNGECTYNGAEWCEVGHAVRDASKPGGWRVTHTDAEQLKYTYPWWN